MISILFARFAGSVRGRGRPRRAVHVLASPSAADPAAALKIAGAFSHPCKFLLITVSPCDPRLGMELTISEERARLAAVAHQIARHSPRFITRMLLTEGADGVPVLWVANERSSMTLTYEEAWGLMVAVMTSDMCI